MRYEATIMVRVCDINYRRLPLIPDGLKIPVEVIVCIQFKPKNKAALNRFESLLAELYKEPVIRKRKAVTARIEIRQW